MIDESNKIKSIPDLAQYIYNEAFRANAYYNLINQYIKYKEQYSESMDVSPCFYRYSYYACVDACIRIVSQLYSKNSGKTLYTLKNKCDLYSSCFSKCEKCDYISPIDLSDYLASHKSAPIAYKFKHTQITDDNTKGVVISDITPSEQLDIFGYRLEKLARYKLSVNNDLANSDISEALSTCIKDMTDLALEFSGWVINALSEQIDIKSVNIEDFENTLKIVEKANIS